jgi:hypothetical protein
MERCAGVLVGAPGFQRQWVGWERGSIGCLAWDNRNLYIGVSVADDLHVQSQSGNQIYRGDSLELQVDSDRQGDWNSSRLSPDDFQILFSPGDFNGLQPSAFRMRATESGQITDAPGHRIVVSAQRTSVGYDLEAAIPWSDLLITPRSGLVLGAALNANDNDILGAAVQEVMMSNVSTRTLTNPTTWGTMVLE